jgi:hypothetical protein
MDFDPANAQPAGAAPAAAQRSAPGTAADAGAGVKADDQTEADAVGHRLGVLTPENTSAGLDLRERPALFIAAWCTHCDEALREAALADPQRRPYLVFTCLRDGDAQKAKEKLSAQGLKTPVYYIKQHPPAGVREVPALVWWDSGLKYIEGAGAVAVQLQTASRINVPAN